jgi:hypothetical protein
MVETDGGPLTEAFSSPEFRFYFSMLAIAVITAFVAIKVDRWYRCRLLVKEFVRQLRLLAMTKDI